MNIAIVTTLYPRYLRDFERRNPTLSSLGFEAHQERLHRDSFGESDHLLAQLKLRGHRGVRIEGNYAALQAKWAAENGLKPEAGSFDIVKAQLRTAKPDVLLVEDCYDYPAAKVKALMADCPSLRTIVVSHGIEEDISDKVPKEALLLTPAKHLAEAWRALGYDAHLYRHAFDPSVLDQLPAAGSPMRVSFVGNCSSLNHPERHAWLAGVARKVPELRVLTDSFEMKPRALARACLGNLRRGRFSRVWNHFASPLPARVQGAVYGLEMFGRLRDSEVTLNCHITLSKPSAGNMRLYEATGVATCLVTDSRSDLHEFFALESEVVTYKDTPDCIEKVRWLLDHPKEAREIALKGQQRTLRDHTYRQRAEQFEGLVAQKAARSGAAG